VVGLDTLADGAAAWESGRHLVDRRGWSLETEPTRPARPHDDVDVAVLRRDVDSLREHLAGWHVSEANLCSLLPLAPVPS